MYKMFCLLVLELLTAATIYAAGVVNGKSGRAVKPESTFPYKFGSQAISLKPKNLAKTFPEAELSIKNTLFKYVSSIGEIEDPVNIKEVVFIEGAQNTLKKTSKFLLSYRLQAKMLFLVFYEQGMLPFLPYADGDELRQFEILKDMGFLYGLVHGALREVPYSQKLGVPRFLYLSDYSKQRLERALKLFADKNQKISIKDLEYKFKAVYGGEYILVLPRTRVTSAPQSFLYYSCENDDIVPYVHITKKDFDSNMYQAGTMRAKNVVIKV